MKHLFKLIVLLLIIIPFVYGIQCTLRTDSCNAGEYGIFCMYQENNTHVGNCTYYTKILCCSDPYLTSAAVKTSCGMGENGTISMYNWTNAHAEIYGEGNYNWHACVGECPWVCTLREGGANACLSGEACLVSLNASTNAHAGECGYYGYQVCCRRESTKPTYSNLGQNATFVYPGKPIKLYAYWTDNGKLSYAILSTNETGQWENKTTYGSPLFLNTNASWSNFTWQNSSIPSGTIIAWKIYTNDTCGNEEVTAEQTFEVITPISLEDTTGAIPLKGWGEIFTFKANVSHAEGYTVNVSLWYAYTSTGPWYFLDSQNCTACSQETQLTFSSDYFSCQNFMNTVDGWFYYKFNATDYAGGTNETDSASFQTRKDYTNSSVVAGENSTVDRYGANSVLLKVGIVDMDKNYQPVIAGRNCSIFIGNKEYSLTTDSTGNCSLNFDPDCSSNYFYPNLYDWLGGMSEADECYYSSNSSKTNVTIKGQLFNTLEKPEQGSYFNNGDMINITGNVSTDCSQEGLLAGVDNVTFELKPHSYTTWEECIPVDDLGNGYYNCTWNSTDKYGDNYDIRFNSSEPYFNPDSQVYLEWFTLGAKVEIQISPELGKGIFFTNDEGSGINEQLNLKIVDWNNATWNYHGWWNSSWLYRKRIRINNSENDNELTDYQVFINLTYDSGMDSNFNDIRFTWYNVSSKSEEKISYWVKKVVSNNYAEIWIKVPRVRARNYETVWVYYGNTTPVTSESNGTLTFIFFDDFSTADKWSLYNCQISDGVLNCTQAGSDYSVENTTQIPMYDIILEAKMWTNDNDGPNAGWDFGIDCNVGGDTDGSCSGNMYLLAPESNGYYKIWEHSDTTWTNIQSVSYTMPTNVWLDVKIELISNGTIATYINDTLVDSFTDTSPLTDDGGYLAIREWEGKVDWVFVRKYSEIEPTYVIREEESRPSKFYQTEYWIKNTGTNPEDFCINVTSDLTCYQGGCIGFTISIDNVAWNNSTYNNISYPQFDTSKKLSNNWIKVAYGITPDAYIYLRFWLYVPEGIPTGVYNTSFSVKGVLANNAC